MACTECGGTRFALFFENGREGHTCLICYTDHYR